MIVADGLLTETNTDYMMYMREIASNARLYKSTMFATYQAYTDLPDAVLVSDKL